MAVRHRLRSKGLANNPARASPVIDYYLLSPSFSEFVGEGSCDGIRIAASWKRHNKTNRLHRILLCARRLRHERQTNGVSTQQEHFHLVMCGSSMRIVGLLPAVFDDPKPGITIDRAPMALPAQISMRSFGVSIA